MRTTSFDSSSSRSNHFQIPLLADAAGIVLVLACTMHLTRPQLARLLPEQRVKRMSTESEQVRIPWKSSLDFSYTWLQLVSPASHWVTNGLFAPGSRVHIMAILVFWAWSAKFELRTCPGFWFTQLTARHAKGTVVGNSCSGIDNSDQAQTQENNGAHHLPRSRGRDHHEIALCQATLYQVRIANACNPCKECEVCPVSCGVNARISSSSPIGRAELYRHIGPRTASDKAIMFMPCVNICMNFRLKLALVRSGLLGFASFLRRDFPSGNMAADWLSSKTDINPYYAGPLERKTEVRKPKRKYYQELLKT
ncbi:hypothetical protein KCU88_g89, partial [Aureobasidium melanogenum]